MTGEATAPPEKPITLDTIKTVFMRAIEDPQRGVPTLIGPPQWGKTHYIREWLMEHMESLLTGQYKKYRNKTMTIPRDRVKMKIAMVNPQSDMPEDIAGWPMRSKGELSFTNPSVTPASLFKKDAPPWALFIDELDKAKDDTLSAMLTLLNPGERRLRETYIPHNVPVVVAMNEPRRELPEPLVARLLFIPFPPGEFGLHPPVANSQILVPPTVTVPTRPAAPGSYFKLKAWFSCPEFARDEAVRRAVISGLFPASAVPGVLGSLEDTYDIRQDWAKTCTVEEFLTMIYMVMGTAASIDAMGKIIVDLQERADGDPTGEFSRACVHALVESEECATIHFRERPSAEDISQMKAQGVEVAKGFAVKAKEHGKGAGVKFVARVFRRIDDTGDAYHRLWRNRKWVSTRP